MRLIDADALIERIEKRLLNGAIIGWLCSIIAGVPAVDAVEVVRCKDCKHGEVDDPDFPDQYCCHARDGWNKADFYCADGERRNGDACAL